ncbi:DctP family TRAP transporter solute-binding subunit [Thermanaerosceptrum fracticalcis]|uniref:DctP family TRAP transporter solute-binding subunit n=1 Tax=Thermanaerosceptrum fracticalcis TaxID=1712410 RepID=A0A7G6E2N6_THEFR|nr:TRAP transporter substrate-binding protein [Thermanaerosceptrum fracticalcis]QNB46340.1 DctP family TRAP transporter solute-binding subunit [Thermanaerosceptrum fracticalcis]
MLLKNKESPTLIKIIQWEAMVMKGKKGLTWMMILLLSISLLIVGCGGNKPAEAPKNNQQGPIVLKLGHVLNESSPFHKGAVEFAKKVETKSNGKLKIEVYPSAQLGNDRTLAEGLQLGTVDMSVSGTATVTGFVPRLQVFDLPFIFRDAEHAYKVLDGPIGSEVLKDFEAKGIVGLAFWENGFRHVTNSKKIIKKPEDVKGMKIRVQEIPLHVSFWKQLGADPTPMAWTEVYTALQQGTVDGQENPVQTIYTQKIYEVQKYISMTGHVYAPAVIMMSKKTYDKLPADLQKIVVEAARETATYERNYIKELEDKAIKELPGLGMQVEMNPDKEAFKAAVQPVYKEYGEKLKVTDLIQRILDTK